MVTMEQVQRGLARYVDSEFTNKLPGWRRWVIGAGAAMLIENFSAVIAGYRDNEIVKTMGLFDPSGTMDIDRIYRYMKAEAAKSPVTFSVPVLGTVTLSEPDVDKLYMLIKES